MLRNSYDFAVCAEKPQANTIRYKTLIPNNGFKLYYDKSKIKPPKTKKEYLNSSHALIFFSHNDKTIIAKRLGIKSERNIRTQASDFAMLPHLIKGTKLITVMPEICKDTLFAGFGCANVPFELPPFDINLIWHERNQNIRSHKWLRDEIINLFKL